MSKRHWNKREKEIKDKEIERILKIIDETKPTPRKTFRQVLKQRIKEQEK